MRPCQESSYLQISKLSLWIKLEILSNCYILLNYLYNVQLLHLVLNIMNFIRIVQKLFIQLYAEIFLFFISLYHVCIWNFENLWEIYVISIHVMFLFLIKLDSSQRYLLYFSILTIVFCCIWCCQFVIIKHMKCLILIYLIKIKFQTQYHIYTFIQKLCKRLKPFIILIEITHLRMLVWLW